MSRTRGGGGGDPDNTRDPDNRSTPVLRVVVLTLVLSRPESPLPVTKIGDSNGRSRTCDPGSGRGPRICYSASASKGADG